MSKQWDRMDREIWNNSEVMQEFEKIILKHASNFEEIVKSAGVIGDAVGDAQALEKAVVPARDATKDLVETLKSNTTDGEEILDEGITDEQYSEAKDSLINELLELSYAAADEGNIKLAYKIERKIYDLEEEFDENL